MFLKTFPSGSLSARSAPSLPKEIALPPALPALQRQRAFIASWFIRLSFLLLILWINVNFNRSPAARSDSWFSDGGFTLNTVENSLHGKRLYLDSFYQYGSLPISLYTFVAKYFGNTITVFSNYILVIHISCLILILGILAVAGCDLSATCLSLLALTPFVIKPLGLQYIFEQFFTLGVIILWEAPSVRKTARGLLLGLILGAMQWVRFGSAAGPIVAVALVDLLALWAHDRSLSRHVLGNWLKQQLFVLAGFLAAESALLIQLFASLPYDVARDTAWPYYMLGSFNIYAPGDRYPHWLSLNYFLGTQLSAVLGLLCAALFLRAQILSPRARAIAIDDKYTAYRFLIPFVAYLFNAAFFYQQVWHYYRGAWLLALAAVCFFRAQRTPARLALALLFLPCAFVAVRPAAAPDLPLTMTTTPNGERLWLTSQVLARTDNLTKALEAFQARTSPAAHDKNGFIIFERQPITVSAHLHFFYRIPQIIRQSMIFPGFLRPRDFPQIETALPHAQAVVLLQKPELGRPPRDICQWNTYQFPKDFCDRVSGLLLDPIPVDGSSWIFPVKSAE